MFGEFGGRRKGVSAVIGVILMVAATIVIAAVLLAMLSAFNMPNQPYLVSVMAEERIIGGIPTLYMIYMGGPDHAMVDALAGTIDGIAFDTPAAGWGTVDGSNADVTVGAVTTDATTVTTGLNNDHIIMTATFIDGTTQVILNTWV
jgi:flagellin-like protein